MQTNEFITYMAERLNADLSREQILDMTRKAQNEILAHDNQITRIVPDPNVNTGSSSMASTANNLLGNAVFEVTLAISADLATKGFLQVEDTGGIKDKYEYQSFSGVNFILADGVLLDKTYTSSATVSVDQFDTIASGALFSSVKNERNIVQFDVRRVSRVYAFSNNFTVGPFYRSGYGGYSTGNPSSRKPDVPRSPTGNEVNISCDTIESKEPLSGDAKIIFWEDNSPPNNPSQKVFFARAQRWPLQLLNEQVPLEIPDRFHTTLLRFAILKDEEYREYGRDTNPKAEYDKSLSEFLAWAAVGVSSTTQNTTEPRF